MLRLLWRQRRRLVVSSFFVSLGLMMMAHARGAFAGIGQPWFIYAATLLLTGLVVAICVALIGAVVLILLPRWRTMLELIGIVVFLNGALDRFWPAVYDIPYIGAFLPFLTTMACFAVIYGEVLDRFRVRLDHRTCRHVNSPLDAETLWRQLVPGAADVAQHWDPLLYALDPVDDDPDSLEATYTHGASLYQLQTMTFVDKSPPYHAKYYHVGQVNPKNRSLVEGTFEITITPRKDQSGCRISLCSNVTAALPRIALAQWFDDDLGDRADFLLAQQTGRRDWSMSGLYRRKVMQFA